MKYAVLAGLMMAQAAAYENEIGEAKKYVQIVEGFLKGSIDAGGFNDIEQCIQDGEEIFRDAESAYEHFKKGDITDAIDGVQDIGKAIEAISAAMKDCSSLSADWPKMKKIGEEFKHPTSFAWHIAGDVWHNKVEITKEVKTAVDDWEKKKWYDFGLQCGEAAAHVFLGQETQMNIKKENLAKMTKGFYGQFGGKFDLEALLFCIYDEDQAALMLDVAYQAFEQFLHDTTTSDKIGDLVGTAIGVVGAYQQFEQGLPVCEQVWTPSEFDIAPVKKTMSFVSNSFENLPVITANIMKHEAEIIKDAEAAYGDYEKFGAFVAKLMQLASEHKEEVAPVAAKPATWADSYPKENRETATEIFQGFMEGTKVGTFNFTNLLLCIYQEDQAAIALYEGVEILEEAWEKKTWQDAIGGVIALVAAVQSAEQGLPVCEAIDTKSYNWGEFHKLAALANDKDKTAKVVEENLLFNGVSISEGVIKAMKAFETGQYKDFGSIMGTTLLLATETEAEKKDLFLY
jgi:hypothetical protein